jgi:hypothetical protein
MCADVEPSDERIWESQSRSAERRGKTTAVIEGIKQGRLAAEAVRGKADEAKKNGIPLHKLIPVR